MRTNNAHLLARIAQACLALALLSFAGCGKKQDPSAETQKDVEQWRAKYEELARKNEEIYPQLEELDGLRKQNKDLAQKVDGLTRDLSAARAQAEKAVASPGKQALEEKEAQIAGLLQQAKQLKDELALARGEGQQYQALKAKLDTLEKAKVELAALGAQLMESGLRPAALQVLLRAVQLGQEDPEVLLQVAYLYGELRDEDRAAQWYARAAEAVEKLAPPRPRLAAKVYSNYGATLVALGKPVQALQWYERSVKADPAYTPVQFNLGLLYAEHYKDSDKAIAAFRRHVALGGSRSLSARNAILRLQEEAEEGPAEEPEAPPQPDTAG